MNNNILTKTTDIAMLITSQYLSPGDYAIDATCGNGNDTLSLSKILGPEGRVLAIDIQEEALDTAKTVTCKDCTNVSYINGNFKDIDMHSANAFKDRKPKAVIFNLGYLPGGDKTITTSRDDSLEAVKKSLDLIETGGVVTIVLYSGHEAGKQEKETILNYAGQLSSSIYHSVYTKMENQHKNPPEILFITRKK